MDILLMFLGILSAIASLVLSIVSIIHGTSRVLPIILLLLALLLVRLGRTLNKKKPKK